MPFSLIKGVTVKKFHENGTHNTLFQDILDNRSLISNKIVRFSFFNVGAAL